MQHLSGKTAIVTGAASGIGAATCERLVAEGAGVVIADINGEGAAELANRLGSDAHAQVFDAEDPASIEALVAAAVEHFGRLDILHNNVAITTPEVHGLDSTAPDTPMEVWVPGDGAH